MAALVRRVIEVNEYIRKLRGGSQPVLVRASDGLFYVAKFSGNLQGANLLFNESIGTELYKACGLRTPSWKPLLVTDSFLDRHPECWIQTEQGARRPEAGLCFGSRFLGTNGVRLFEVLPATRYKRIRNRASFFLAWLLDICAEHADNRQALFVEKADGWLEAYFVDQGHFFGGPEGKQRPHFVASRYLDPRIYEDIFSIEFLGIYTAIKKLDADALWRRARCLPDAWRSISALGGLERCLERLSKPELLQNVFDTIADSVARGMGIEYCVPLTERKPPVAVLRPGVQPRFGPANIRLCETARAACG